jgi:hypothetical protein
MIDFGEKLVGPEQRSPSFEYRMRHLKHPNIDHGIVRCQLQNEVLGAVRRLYHDKGRNGRTSTKVSHLCQKSLSAMTLMDSPSWFWIAAGTDVINPMISCLMATTSDSGSL